MAMTIDGIETFLVPPRWLFVWVEADNARYRWRTPIWRKTDGSFAEC